MSPRRHLVIFAKAPRLGAVKTRLARPIGAMAALRFHRACLARAARRLGRDPRWTTWLFVTPDDSVRIDRLWPRGLARRPQGRGDIGARMARPFRTLPPGPVVLVGTDIPAMERHHVAAAFRALGRAHAVFGPARDGGFWLVGLRRGLGLECAFTGVAWSTDTALAETVANLDPRRRVAFVETLEDVDDVGAYRRWRRAVLR